MLYPAGILRICRQQRRIEATEVILPLRLPGVLIPSSFPWKRAVRSSGEVLAKMDTRVLQEQRLEAIAQIKEAGERTAAARALLEPTPE